MSQDAPGAGVETAVDDFEPDQVGRPGSRVGMVVAALIAVGASAGLAWWFAVPDRAADVSARPAPQFAASRPPNTEAPAPLRFAAADPDPGQVREAWVDVRQGYAEAGPSGLVRASQACAKGLPAAPQRLDYCLAYDIYASAVAPQRGDGADWFANAGDRDLALALTALPQGVSPDNRLAQVAFLTKAVLPKAAPARPKSQAVRAVRKPPVRAKIHKTRRHRPPRRSKPVRAGVRRTRAAAAIPTLDDYLNRPRPGEDPLDPPH